MATTMPPAPSPSTPPPVGRPPARRAVAGRLVAVGALTAVIVVVLALVLSTGGGADYNLIFPDAGSLVRGDQVQVGGVPVGSVKDIVLLKDYRVRVAIHVNSSLTPLHEGTTGEIRVPSLFSVANRYIALVPGPNNRPAIPPGSTLPATATPRSPVDLDQLFNTFNPRTRRGLAQFIQGSAEQYSGVAPQLQLDALYFSPAIAAVDHVFAELARDQPTFTSFLVETAKAVTTIAARRRQLTDLVSNADTMFAAIGSRQSSFARGLKALPVTFREGNRTFEELPPTLAALRALVDASKPTTGTLAPFFAKLRQLVIAATPAVGDFGKAFSKPGPSNDLTDAFRALPALARELKTASPDGVRSLEESLPVTALFGPYSPDLEGLIRDFGQGTAYYDASGHYARVSSIFPDFELGSGNNLKPVNPQQAVQGLKTGQLQRCPGSATQPAADGSSPFVDNGLLGCNPAETP